MTVTACFGHHPYASAQLATNAAALHALAYPSCEGVTPWACAAADHWHIGHHTAGAGHRCKTDVGHRAAAARVRKVAAYWRR